MVIFENNLAELNKLINYSDKIGLLDNKEYHSRYIQEFKHLVSQGQVDNILLAYRIKEVINTFDVPFFIRGSAGGSLILYLLDFTPIDPVKHNILFERFINSYRDTLGDVDFDLPRTFRDKIMAKVYRKLKRDGIQVGRLCTKVMFKENSAIRETLRRVCLYRKTIPRQIMREEGLLREYVKAKCGIKLDKILDKSKELMGKIRYMSSHVGGITVLKEGEWDDTIFKKSSPVPIIPSDKYDVDAQKRFKIDLLSNTGLDILQQIYPGQKMDESTFPYDEEIFKMIGEGRTIGVLFGESPLMIQTLKNYHQKNGIKDITDIAKCLSIIRPMGRNEGKDSDLVFDDDWIEELSKMLNITLDEADSKRRILAKESRKYSENNEMGDLISHIRKIVSPARLKQLMQIKSYGFCKAHATNYAQLIYCQTYAKKYKPAEFYCAVLNTLDGRIYKDWVYFLEALKDGVSISATKKRDVYITKISKSQKIIIPKSGIQRRLFPLSIHQELKQFGGFTSLKDLSSLGELVACSRMYKNLTFLSVLEGLELKNRIINHDEIEEIKENLPVKEIRDNKDFDNLNFEDMPPLEKV